MVTNGEYRAFNADHDSGSYHHLSLNDDRQPATGISFDAAVAYCDELTERHHQSGVLASESFFRLPSRAEWSNYARCGDYRTLSLGGNGLQRSGIMVMNRPSPASPIGTRSAATMTVFPSPVPSRKAALMTGAYSGSAATLTNRPSTPAAPAANCAGDRGAPASAST